MTAIAGYGGSVKLGDNAIAEIDKWDISIDSDLYDTTAFSSAWHTSIPGLKKWSGTFSGRLYEGDTNGQAVIQTALLNGTVLSANFFIDSTHSYSGDIYIKQQQVKVAVSATVDKLTCPVC
jgi:hypothetical protein